MNLHNLRTVVGFEFFRSITKVHFWALSLGLPLLIGAVFWLVSASSSTVESRLDSTAKVTFAFTYDDASGVIEPAIAQAMGGRPADQATGRAEVLAGRGDAHLSYPADPTREPIRVIGRDVGVFETSRYSALAQRLFTDSVALRIGNPDLARLSRTEPEVSVTTVADGRPSGGMASVIAPGVFLVLFYVSILLLGGQMLNVTVEEKENRVSEMILTTMSPTTLIVGKVIALLGVGVLQTLIFAVPSLLIAGSLGASLGGTGEAGADLGPLTLDVGLIGVGLLLFLAGFGMFTGMLVAIGSVMPNSKEASSAFAGVVVLMFLPFYAGPMIIADPHGIGSQLFLLFPLTSPVTALLRNAIGGLSGWEALLVVTMLFGFAWLFLRIGVRLFRSGSISYDVRLSLRKAFG